jgi:hypothetical protein
MRETGRENAFCAHAIFGAPSMVEAFEDLRVAENPFVTEPPHELHLVIGPAARGTSG